MKSSLKEYAIPSLITIILLTVSFILHFKSCGSSMSSPSDIWQGKIDLHRSLYPFTIRYFTTYSTLFLQKLTTLSIRESFFIIQFCLALILGPVFYCFLRRLKFNRVWSNIGVFIFFTSYPMMAAHFEPVHTWDDFWTYLFLILSFSVMVRNRFLLSAICFTLACFSRDQALIFYPVFILALFLFGEEKKLQAKIFYSSLPIIIFGSFLILVWQDPEPKRFELIKFNFENALRTRDTLFSVYISFGFLWLTSIMAIFKLASKEKGKIIRLIFWGGVRTLPINIIITLFFTAARETRILFPPFVFVIPLSLLILEPVHKYLGKTLPRLKRVLLLIVFHALMVGGVYLAWVVFPYFEYRQCANYCREWAGINIGIIIMLILIYSVVPKARLIFDTSITIQNPVDRHSE